PSPTRAPSSGCRCACSNTSPTTLTPARWSGRVSSTPAPASWRLGSKSYWPDSESESVPGAPGGATAHDSDESLRPVVVTLSPPDQGHGPDRPVGDRHVSNVLAVMETSHRHRQD